MLEEKEKLENSHRVNFENLESQFKVVCEEMAESNSREQQLQKAILTLSDDVKRKEEQHKAEIINYQLQNNTLIAEKVNIYNYK